MKTRRLVLVAALLGAALPAAAQPTGFFLDPRIAWVVPGGSVPVAATPAFGGAALFDARGDLNYKEQATALPNLRFIRDKYRFEVSYQALTFNGSMSGTSAVALARRALTASPLYTSLDLRNFSLSFRYDVYKKNGFSAGVGGDYEDVWFTSFATDASGALGSVDRHSGAPLLTLGLNLTDPSGKLFFDAQGGYVRLSGLEMQKGRVEAGWSFAKYSGLKIGAETLRYRDQIGSVGVPSTDLRLSNVSGGFFFNF